MIKYTSIRAALRLIPKPLFKESTDLDFLSWMLDGFRQVDLPQTFEEKIKFFEIINNKVELPQEIKEIKNITYLMNTPSESDLTSLTDCLCNTTSASTESDTNNVCEYTIAYKQFLDSPYYRNNFAPLQYKGNMSNSLICKDCPNRYAQCQNYFTVDKNCVLHTNLKEGYLCINYYSEMVDENNDFLIPDITELKQFLAYYAIAKHWEERSMLKEQSAANIAQDYLIKAEIYFKKVRGILIMRGINPNDIVKVQYDNFQNYLKLPELYVFAR